MHIYIYICVCVTIYRFRLCVFSGTPHGLWRSANIHQWYRPSKGCRRRCPRTRPWKLILQSFDTGQRSIQQPLHITISRSFTHPKPWLGKKVWRTKTSKQSSYQLQRRFGFGLLFGLGLICGSSPKQTNRPTLYTHKRRNIESVLEYKTSW